MSAPEWKRGRLAERVDAGAEVGAPIHWRPAIADPVWHVEVQLPSGTYIVLDRAAVMTSEQLAMAGYEDTEHRAYIELVRGRPTEATCRGCDWHARGHTDRVLAEVRDHVDGVDGGNGNGY